MNEEMRRLEREYKERVCRCTSSIERKGIEFWYLQRKEVIDKMSRLAMAQWGIIHEPVKKEETKWESPRTKRLKKIAQQINIET